MRNSNPLAKPFINEFAVSHLNVVHRAFEHVNAPDLCDKTKIGCVELVVKKDSNLHSVVEHSAVMRARRETIARAKGKCLIPGNPAIFYKNPDLG